MNDQDAISDDLAVLLDACQLRLMYALQGTSPLINTTLALRAILLALEYPTHAVDTETRRRLTQALFQVGPPIAVNVKDELPVDRVIFALAAASQLVGMFGRSPAELFDLYHPDLVRDRIDHTALLGDELDAIHRRREIRDRGDVLRRAVEIGFAMRRPAPEGAPLH